MATWAGAITGFERETQTNAVTLLKVTLEITITDGAPLPAQEFVMYYPVNLMDGRTPAQAKDVICQQGFGKNMALNTLGDRILADYEMSAALNGVQFPIAFP